MKTIGSDTRMPEASAVGSILPTSVMNDPNRDTAAMTAEPMATPLVIALVVLPTASRSAMIWRAPSPRPTISPMPLALSEMGPKESMATLLPVSVSMPMPVMATPYSTQAVPFPQ